MSKYEALRSFLQAQKSQRIPMTFAEIEAVLGFKLPKSQMYPAWWSNNASNNVMTRAWLAAGFKTEQVDIEGRKLVFRRVAPSGIVDGASGFAEAPAPELKLPRRHPAFGWMKGTVTIAPGTDLTAPADPDWADIAWGKEPSNKLQEDDRS